jgi:hypothetical protein
MYDYCNELSVKWTVYMKLVRCNYVYLKIPLTNKTYFWLSLLLSN